MNEISLELCDCPMDCFDLQDWIVENNPQVYEATRYLDWSLAVDCWHKIYHNAAKKAPGAPETIQRLPLSRREQNNLKRSNQSNSREDKRRTSI